MRRADPEWKREQTLTIGEQGIRLESMAETTEIPWTAVKRAVALRRLLRDRLGEPARLDGESA